MREPRAVGWMKYFDGRIAFEKYSAFIPDDALSLGWRKLYTDDALQAAAVEAQNQQARNAELEAERDHLERELAEYVDAAKRLAVEKAEFRREAEQLQAELAALREAAQTVVDSQMNARMTQSTHWKDVTVDALAALLQESAGR